jgi:hypothetical protein
MFCLKFCNRKYDPIKTEYLFTKNQVPDEELWISDLYKNMFYNIISCFGLFFIKI